MPHTPTLRQLFFTRLHLLFLTRQHQRGGSGQPSHPVLPHTGPSAVVYLNMVIWFNNHPHITIVTTVIKSRCTVQYVVPNYKLQCRSYLPNDHNQTWYSLSKLVLQPCIPPKAAASKQAAPYALHLRPSNCITGHPTHASQLVNCNVKWHLIRHPLRTFLSRSWLLTQLSGCRRRWMLSSMLQRHRTTGVQRSTLPRLGQAARSAGPGAS